MTLENKGEDTEAVYVKRRRYKSNNILTLVSNFLLALSIGAVATGLARLFDNDEPIDHLTFLTILSGLAFLMTSVILVYAKEPET